MEGEKVGEVILTMKDIDKSFPGVHALKKVSLEVRRGEVHALMGENGAGKSTLMKILTGIYSKDSGQIIYEGKEWSSRIHGGPGCGNRYCASGAEYDAAADRGSEHIHRPGVYEG